MSENEGFILKSEQYNQEEWCEMFRRVSETCKDLRTENECLQNQLQQKENIIKEVREYAGELRTYDNDSIEFEISNDIFRILDKGE